MPIGLIGAEAFDVCLPVWPVYDNDDDELSTQ